jgi:hypothetical protein
MVTGSKRFRPPKTIGVCMSLAYLFEIDSLELFPLCCQNERLSILHGFQR